MFVIIILFFFNILNAKAQDNYLTSFSDPRRIWGNGIERVVEEAYRQFFTTRIIGGRVMNIRIPFAMNTDRDALSERPIYYIGGGKGNPRMLMSAVDRVLNSNDFSVYVNTLSSGREKVIIFDIAARSWTVSHDSLLIARIKAGSFTSLPHKPHIYVTGRGALESDIYNYLYCVGNIGIDCSGFVWHILAYIGEQGGIDLGRILNPALGVPINADTAQYIGTGFLNSRSSQVIQVNDEIRNLRPADIILFTDILGDIVHSAVIQSIDYTRGTIRYLQCNNIAPVEERGVHEAFIYFDPSNITASLKDPSLHWTKKRFGAFPGEEIPFADDGERYRFRLNGGGKVVRLAALVPVIERINRGN
ncbi:MAG: peptidoglycan endopeptidase [Treponema sp.]|nr:peptidoglycan endopeptidase [Treponema sp.]